MCLRDASCNDVIFNRTTYGPPLILVKSRVDLASAHANSGPVAPILLSMVVGFTSRALEGVPLSMGMFDVSNFEMS